MAITARKAIISTLVIMMALVAGLMIHGCSLMADEGPYDDAHLMPTVPSLLTDEENALTYFVQAGDAFVLSEPEKKRFVALFYPEKLWDKPVSEPFIRQLLSEKTVALELLEKGTRLHQLHYPESVIPKTLDEIKNPPPTTKVSPIMDVARLMVMQAHLDLKQGRTTEAAEKLEIAMKAGNLLGREDLVGVVMGIVAQEMAFEVWCDLLNRGNWDSGQTTMAWKRMRAMIVSRERIVEGLKWSYAELRLMFSLEAFKEGEQQAIEGATGAKPGTPVNKVAHFLTRISPLGQYLSHPNRTLRMYAACYSDMIHEVETLGKDQRKDCPDPRKLFNKENALQPNIYGRIMMSVSVPRFSHLWVTAGKQEARVVLGDTLLAVRLYQRDHGGQLPADLSALVPVYLKAVPVNPFDGEPPAYDSAKRLISLPVPTVDPKYPAKPLETRISASF